MNEHEHTESTGAMQQVRKHQFATFLIVAILVALFLVYIALSLYHSSGTFQLDLSRPGFAKAREDITRERQVFEGYSKDGQINAAALKEFNQLYSQELKDATAIDAFSGEALTDASLQIPTN